MNRLDTNLEALDELVRGSSLFVAENSRSYIFNCPRCEKQKKLFMLKADGRFVCWVCGDSGFRGKPEFALTEILGMSLGELRIRLYGREAPQAASFISVAANLIDWWGDGPPDPDAVQLVPMGWPLDCYPIDHKFSAKGLEYLESRGVPLAIAQEYGIRYCPPQRRVMFPISSGGTLYGWQARLVGPDKYEDPETGEEKRIPKILTTRGLKKEQTLMFADRIAGSRHAILCEGPMDAIKCHLAGGNVATMGKIVSRTQIELLRNAGIQVMYLALDPDASAETRRLISEFSDLEVRLLHPAPGFKDLGEMSFTDVRAAFDAAPRITAGNSISRPDFSVWLQAHHLPS